MSKTIGFFGDSFCAEAYNHHSVFYKYTSYISQLAIHYDAKIVNLGHGGTGVWDTLLLQLKPLIDNNQVPDICVFVWTLPGRIFNRQVRRLNQADTMYPKLHTYNPFKRKIWNAAKEFYTHLYDQEKEELEYIACLKYIDDVVLPTLPSSTKIVHLWSTGKTTGWSNDTIRPSAITYPYTWKTGVEIRPSLLSVSLYDANIEILQTDHRTNHLDGNFKNGLITDWIKRAISEPDQTYDYSLQIDTLYDRSPEDNPPAI